MGALDAGELATDFAVEFAFVIATEPVFVVHCQLDPATKMDLVIMEPSTWADPYLRFSFEDDCCTSFMSSVVIQEHFVEDLKDIAAQEPFLVVHILDSLKVNLDPSNS